MIDGKPIGMLLLLEEECFLGQSTDDSYLNKVESYFGKGKKYENAYFAKHKTKPVWMISCY